MGTCPTALLEHMDQSSCFELAVCILASGSKGNTVYITDGTTSLLVDAGLSGIEIERRMQKRGFSPAALDGIVVSHEHADHVQGVGVLSRRYRLPVYVTRKTAQAAAAITGNVHQHRFIECGMDFRVQSLVLHPFSVSHDAADPAGFTVSRDKRKIGIATDLGIATAMVKRHLYGCEVLVLETNHDPGMLINGPYPWPLKQRIQSRSGHLSNQEAVRLLAEIRCRSLRHVFLAHLSETNNHPDLALSGIRTMLAGSGSQCSVADQEAGSGIAVL